MITLHRRLIERINKLIEPMSCFPDRNSKLAKQIKKEILLVRRNLAIKRGQLVDTIPDDDTGSVDMGKFASFAM